MTLGSSGPSASQLTERNKEKRFVAEDNLTQTQKEAAEDLTSCIETGGICNLVGEVGIGKTFLAWCLVDSNDEWEYSPWLPVDKKVESNCVFVDNVASTKTASRRARELKTFNEEVDSVVVISEKRVPEVNNVVGLHENSN
jgi:ABC-type glutathione transport system ATPase component